MSELATRIVIPLVNRSSFGGDTTQGLTPEIDFENERLLLLAPQISSISTKQLNTAVGSLTHSRDQIVGALDFAVTGL